MGTQQRKKAGKRRVKACIRIGIFHHETAVKYDRFFFILPCLIIKDDVLFEKTMFVYQKSIPCFIVVIIITIITISIIPVIV